MYKCIIFSQRSIYELIKTSKEPRKIFSFRIKEAIYNMFNIVLEFQMVHINSSSNNQKPIFQLIYLIQCPGCEGITYHQQHKHRLDINDVRSHAHKPYYKIDTRFHTECEDILILLLPILPILLFYFTTNYQSSILFLLFSLQKQFFEIIIYSVFIRYQMTPSHSSLILLLLILFVHTQARWTQDQAAKWYAKYNWSAGYNYAPSYAVNEIQMWEAFNETTIDRELTWSAQIGFSKLRVFLHVSPFVANSTLFIERIQRFLVIAKKHNHHVIPVLFDDCWNPHYQDGKQPDPIPGVHNSQWVQCPGQVPIQEAILQNYVVTILSKFKNDDTIVLWDVYNQVGNSNYLDKSLPLLRKIFGWARAVNPSQPLSSGFWNGDVSFENINNYLFSESDVITFHAYCDQQCTRKNIERMKTFRRPVICTEYMARNLNSKFITHLPIFKQSNVWAINWGFVFGRTQTYFPWWSKKGDPVPTMWFHDVIHANGTPFDKNETTFISSITKLTYD